MHGLLNDLRFAIRSLRRQPGLTAAAALCLALGIGANTTVFSTLTALVLRPIPAVDPRGLVMIGEQHERNTREYERIGPATAADVRRETSTMRHVTFFAWWDVNLTGGDEPERVTAFRAESNLFSLLGARPKLGRVYADDEGVTPGVLLSEALWQRRFGADPAVIGRAISLDGEEHVVTGVMDADFIFPVGAELWVPLHLTATQETLRGARILRVMGRLAPGATLDGARAEMRTLAARLAAEHPETNAGWTIRVEDANAAIAANRRPYILAMQLSVALVLLIACVNVANLLLARASGREREIAVRVALGAGRWRVMRQLLVESLLLALVGGALGILVALWGVLALRSSLPVELLRFNPGWTQIRVDQTALVFTALVSVVTGLVFGIAPALQAMRAVPGGVLREGRGSGGGARRHRARSALAVMELAMAVVLVATTTLAVRSFVHLDRADPGFDPAPLLAMEVTVPQQGYDREAIVNFYERLLPRLDDVAGVRAAGAVSMLPMAWEERREEITIDGWIRDDAAAAPPDARIRMSDPGYFAALGVPVLQGRGVSTHDVATSTPVAVVSTSAATLLWPGESPIGRRLRISSDTTAREVIGIVPDVRHNPNTRIGALYPTVYVPFAQRPQRTMSLVIRAEEGQDPASLTAAIQREIVGLDPAIAAGRIATMPRMVFAALSPQRATAGTLAVLGFVALVLAMVGVYGVMAYATAQRTHELGVRAALGATRAELARLVLRRGLWLTTLGVVIGVVWAYLAAQAMKGILHGVTPADPLTFGGTVALLAGISLLASYLPARRAARVAPSIALRAE